MSCGQAASLWFCSGPSPNKNGVSQRTAVAPCMQRCQPGRCAAAARAFMRACKLAGRRCCLQYTCQQANERDTAGAVRVCGAQGSVQTHERVCVKHDSLGKSRVAGHMPRFISFTFRSRNEFLMSHVPGASSRRCAAAFDLLSFENQPCCTSPLISSAMPLFHCSRSSVPRPPARTRP